MIVALPLSLVTHAHIMLAKTKRLKPPVRS